MEAALTMNREKVDQNFERVPVSLAPTIAEQLEQNVFNHKVSRSGFVEAALQELMRKSPAEIARTLKKYNVGRRRKV